MVMCKLLTENDEPVKLLRQHLEDCDNDCPNYHYTRVNLHQEEIDSLDIVVDESSDDNCLMTNVVVYRYYYVNASLLSYNQLLLSHERYTKLFKQFEKESYPRV